jgi:hypothetical protein
VLSSREPSSRHDSEGDKNALQAYGLAMSLPRAGKMNVRHGSAAGSAFLPRRIAGRSYSTHMSSGVEVLEVPQYAVAER